MRKIIIPAAIFSLLLGVGLSINAYTISARVKRNLNEERYKRMVAEEGFQNAKADLGKIRADLASAQQTLSSIQEILNKGKGVTSDLQAQLEAVRKERDAVKTQLEKIRATTVVPEPPVAIVN